jgi:hypothetical protein
MQKIAMPFNISLLDLTPEKLKGLGQVAALDHFDGATSDFHPQGLFSTKIFSRVGDDMRSLRFGYIDIKATIFHPLVFFSLIKLKRMYGEIMSGKAWAVWDDEKKDFERGKPGEGARTGYAFFVEHWRDIVYTDSASNRRQQQIELINKHQDIAMTSKIVVMPAGLRDLEIDEFGRKSEDEVNKIYRQLIALSNIVVQTSLVTNPEVVDKARYDMQMRFCELYDHIESLIKGKKKLFLGKVASRRIFNGTRNVITSMNTAVTQLGKKGTPNVNSTIIGLYQYLQATLPVSTAQTMIFLQKMFPDINAAAKLVDPKTLRVTDVFLHNRYYDKWATTEGVEKVISSFKEEDLRNMPLMIDGYYLGLIYLGPDGTFKVMQSIDELPKTRLAEHVRPLTLTDVLYLSVYRHFSKYPIFVTRYPVTGVGSIYPSNTHLRVTVDFVERKMLSNEWLDAGEEYVAHEYPIKGSAFVNSLIPHSRHLGKLNADFDGDTVSGNIAYSDEAIEETNAFFKTKRAYIGTDGKIIYSCAVSTVELVVYNLTGEPDMGLAVEVYQESDDPTFTYNGSTYSLNKVLALSAEIKPISVEMSEFNGRVRAKDQLDKLRLMAADTSYPLLGIVDNKRYYVLDGQHRLYNLSRVNAKAVSMVLTSEAILQAALI